VLVEPPRPDLLARAGVSRPDLTLVRHAAVAAALALATLSRGDALVLAVLLVIAAWRPVALAVVPALVASSWRWGSSSLEALAGAQTVLGPAGLVGPPAAAATSWLAGLAILLVLAGRPSAPNLPRGAALLAVLATGATLAAVVAGPGGGGAVWIRVGAGAVATVGAVAVARIRDRLVRAGRALDAAAALAAVAALVLASRAAPPWGGTIDAAAIGQGIAVAAAVALLVLVGPRTFAAMRDRRA